MNETEMWSGWTGPGNCSLAVQVRLSHCAGSVGTILRGMRLGAEGLGRTERAYLDVVSIANS